MDQFSPAARRVSFRNRTLSSLHLVSGLVEDWWRCAFGVRVAFRAGAGSSA